MPRAKEAIDRFTELKVDLILGGHLHRAYIGNSLDLYSSKDRWRAASSSCSRAPAPRSGAGPANAKRTRSTSSKSATKSCELRTTCFSTKPGISSPSAGIFFRVAACTIFRTIIALRRAAI